MLLCGLYALLGMMQSNLFLGNTARESLRKRLMWSSLGSAHRAALNPSFHVSDVTRCTCSCKHVQAPLESGSKGMAFNIVDCCATAAGMAALLQL